MKKRNKKWSDDKEHRRLKRDLSKNRDTQRNLGWVELDDPIFIGWTAKIQPRADIKNREDGWVFEWICRNVTTDVFSRKIENFSWNKKIPAWAHRQDPPHVKCISESLYNDLHPQIKKHFCLDRFQAFSKEYKYRFGNWYICTIPEFYWDIIYVKAYKTKVQLIDEILLQEEDEIKSEIERRFYDKYWGYNSAPRAFRNHLNRIQRRKSKKDIIRQINELEPEYTPNYKDAAWLWW
jgi:hypothetical protein